MEQKPETPLKASEVILQLRDAITKLTALVNSQNLQIGLISNKLNSVMEYMSKQGAPAPKFTVEAIQNQTPFSMIPETEKQVPVSSDFTLPQEKEPKGFRRTSRPESYQGDNAVLPVQPKFPTQLPKPPPGRAEVIVPPQATNVQVPKAPQAPVTFTEIPEPPPARVPNGNVIPVQQRVVNANGKSIFLADVEIFNVATHESVFKTRTNGTGKWMASLPVGNYEVSIKKVEAATKERQETKQQFQVDGLTSTLELQMLIIK